MKPIDQNLFDEVFNDLDLGESIMDICHKDIYDLVEIEVNVDTLYERFRTYYEEGFEAGYMTALGYKYDMMEGWNKKNGK